MKKLVRKLKQQHKCLLNKVPLTSDKLKSANLLVLANPQSPFSQSEIEVLRQYVEEGGALLAMGGEGGERRNGSNLG